MKVVSYNVNGIRSALTKNFTGWLAETKPDVLCLQEIKAKPEQFDKAIFDFTGYHHYWYPADKKGYSGVGILSLQKPIKIEYGCGNDLYDFEGRVMRADFADGTSVMSVYHPSGSSGDLRQSFKMEWLTFFKAYILEVLIDHPKLIISGDFNICHQDIDIHNPKGLNGTSGFTPEERLWISEFLEIGMIDSFRYINSNQIAYTWWSFRAGARKNNKGWRIDYNMVSAALKDTIAEAYTLPDALHSDHCPAVVELNI
ncbi:MAG: exodeoxyribonuclease III [Bacteroidota bacterium]|nr:exodeoxyribonuclease III [Bacteroidota bacterium]